MNEEDVKSVLWNRFEKKLHNQSVYQLNNDMYNSLWRQLMFPGLIEQLKTQLEETCSLEIGWKNERR